MGFALAWCWPSPRGDCASECDGDGDGTRLPGGKGDVKTAADTVRIGVLGPLEVTDVDGRLVRVGGHRVRALLILLALEPGRVVPVHSLIGRLWPAGAARRRGERPAVPGLPAARGAAPGGGARRRARIVPGRLPAGGAAGRGGRDRLRIQRTGGRAGPGARRRRRGRVPAPHGTRAPGAAARSPTWRRRNSRSRPPPGWPSCASPRRSTASTPTSRSARRTPP